MVKKLPGIFLAVIIILLGLTIIGHSDAVKGGAGNSAAHIYYTRNND